MDWIEGTREQVAVSVCLSSSVVFAALMLSYYYLSKAFEEFPYFALISPVPLSSKHLAMSVYNCLVVGCRVKVVQASLKLLSANGYVIILLGMSRFHMDVS
jgi:hypothetical protein